MLIFEHDSFATSKYHTLGDLWIIRIWRIKFSGLKEAKGCRLKILTWLSPCDGIERLTIRPCQAVGNTSLNGKSMNCNYLLCEYSLGGR